MNLFKDLSVIERATIWVFGWGNLPLFLFPLKYFRSLQCDFGYGQHFFHVYRYEICLQFQ